MRWIRVILFNGPFRDIPYTTYRINPVGVAEGKYSKKKRLIVDLSAPHEDIENPSLNVKHQYSLQYVSIDDAIKIIKNLGKGAMLIKTDITDAFKNIPLSPDMWSFHGIQWDDCYYFYNRLVLGSRSSPKIFDNLSIAVNAGYIVAKHNYGIENILHLLDDFLVIVQFGEDASAIMNTLLNIFDMLGIPLSTKKTEGPCTELEYFGIILDTINMEARLPLEKVKRIQGILESFSHRKTCTKRELLSLLGHLNFASRVIHPGRSFVSHLIKLSTTVKKTISSYTY